MSAHNDAAFLRMFLLVLGALVVFTVLILIAASTITSSVEEARGDDPRMRAAVAERIKPVGAVNVAAPTGAPPVAAAAPVAAASPAAAAAPKSGAEVVVAACNNCHVAGVLGAPKIGDKAAWEKRLAAGGGIDALTHSAINGKGAMPARGGAVLTDAEVRAGVEHMLAESGVDVKTAAPASAAAPANEATPAPPAEKPMTAAVVPVAAPASPSDAGAPVDLAKGESVYRMACLACHATGAAGAPKLGDKAAWAPRIAQGMEALHASAINGKGAMPPKGGRVDLPDADIRSAVAYMVKASE